MAGIAHIGVGFAAKSVAPKAPLFVLVLATELIDILCGVFVLAGLDNLEFAPWSHGLFMSTIWSISAAVIAARLYHNNRIGMVVGLLVFSHWIVDLITHPMFGGPPDLPLLFGGSPKVGLGLYGAIGLGPMTAVEVAVPLLGLAVYRHSK